MHTTLQTRHPELIGAEEMRTILGIGRSAFYELARRDALPVPTIRVGKRLLFSRRAIEALLDRQHGDSPPERGDESRLAESF